MGDRKRKFDIDKETGEYIKYIEWREGDVLRSKEQREWFFDRMARYADKTDFIWLKFAYNHDFYASISPENLTRLMYFASFCNNECYVMTDTDIKCMLEINPNQVKSFREEFFDRVIIKDEDRLYLDGSLFGKGTFEESDKDYIRLFTVVTQQLYKIAKIRVNTLTCPISSV